MNIRKYNSIAEFLAAKREHGPMIGHRSAINSNGIDLYSSVEWVCSDRIKITKREPQSYDSFTDPDRYVWEDGSPVGVIEN